LSGDCQLHENWPRGTRSFLKDLNEFLFSLCTLSDLGEIRCNDSRLMLLGVYSFHENRRRNGRALLLDINKITSTRVP
jgi:hypothetical protein